jgi:hypothetical protein
MDPDEAYEAIEVEHDPEPDETFVFRSEGEVIGQVQWNEELAPDAPELGGYWLFSPS